ncbi:MAG: response regulator transcription factor [Chloroflexi bacterium]|nr:response regulator transcription factor [Chloroflexota bacterium]
MTNQVGKETILIVDDDPKIVAFIARQLRADGYDVESAMDGSEGVDKAAEIQPNLILMDISMPVMDGIEALVRLREWYEGPIIILSATDEERKKVEALDKGADDYLTKPFGIPELLARVRSAMRRANMAHHSSSADESVVEAGDVRIDLAHRTVKKNGNEVSLTRTEYELLRYLAMNAGKVLTHRELLREVWGPEYGEETEYLRTFVKQLRRKLEQDPARPTLLVTQPGLGYRLTA